MPGPLRRRPRISFVTRLLTASVATIAVIVAAISVYLLVAFDRQARSNAIATVDERAATLTRLVDTITLATGRSVVTQLAAETPLADALVSPDPPTATRGLFAGAGALSPAGHAVAILDSGGRVVADTLPAGVPRVDGTLPAVRAAVAGPAAAAGGLELIGSGAARLLSADSARRVERQGQTVGVVVDIAPLSGQLAAWGSAVGPAGYTIGFVAADAPERTVRLAASGSVTTAPTSGELADGLRGGGAIVDGTWSAPDGGEGAPVAVAAGFRRVADATGAPVGLLGVEVALSLFPGPTAAQAATLALIGVGVLVVTGIAVVLFTDRFVRRPVIELQRGMARIASGDYGAEVPVRGSDELADLAGSVNRMRRQIEENVAAVERGRARLDAAVGRLGEVSRALTTTTSGVAALEEAVVRTAAALVGADVAAAVLLRRRGDALEPSAVLGVAGTPRLEDWGVVADLVAGRVVHVDDRVPPGWAAGGLVAVPMFASGEVVGALAVVTAPGHRAAEGDDAALAVLANNAAVALENTRRFDQERETVRRLVELDQAKSDFLVTVQHELRTPLTAVMGIADLLEMCWATWVDDAKLSSLRDLQVATRSLHGIVETVIDYSLLEMDRVGLHPGHVPLRAAVEEALEAVRARTADEPAAVEVSLLVPGDVAVWADPGRFGQVLRALLDNALKFRRGGHVEVSADSEGAMVRLVVRDDGTGIPSDALPHVFDRFFQADSTVTRAHGGLGMGLALARRLAEAHGATITLESVEGRGTVATLLWPSEAAASGRGLASRGGDAASPAAAGPEPAGYDPRRSR